MQNSDTMPTSPGPPVPRKGSGRSARTWPLLSPAVGILALWTVVPLALTLWFSFQGWNLLSPPQGFVGFDNFVFLLTDPDLLTVVWNTLVLVISGLLITVIGGTLIALLFDDAFHGRAFARLLVVVPFFIMPTVSALVWKNLLMHPVYGLFAWVFRSIGLTPIDWFADYPLLAIIIIIAWEWTPFAALILLTSLQSLDSEQVEAARIDGAGPVRTFIHITIPHLSRAVAVVVMLETIFFLTIYAEILVTTVGGPGMSTTNLPFLIYTKALLAFDVGGASAAGIFAIVVANVVTFFFVRAVARQL